MEVTSDVTRNEDDGMTTAELAERTGTTKRTIRYYLAEGLLPEAGGSRSRMEFDREHELRLRLIRHLQEAGLKLSAIRQVVPRHDVSEVEALVEAYDRGETPAITPPPTTSPLRSQSVASSPVGLVYDSVPGLKKAQEQAVQSWRRLPVVPGFELHVSESLARGREDVLADIAEYAKRRLTPEGADSSTSQGKDKT